MKKALLVFALALFLPLSAFALSFTSHLQVGSTGAEVTALQNILIQGGFLAASGPTGYFGSLTQVALKKFQTAKGFSPAGEVGPQTRAALNALASGANPNQALIDALLAQVKILQAQIAAILAARAQGTTSGGGGGTAGTPATITNYSPGNTGGNSNAAKHEPSPSLAEVTSLTFSSVTSFPE